MESNVVDLENDVKFGRGAKIKIGLAILLICGFYIAQKFYSDYQLKQTEPYQNTVQQLLSSPHVKDMIGEPISIARFVLGDVSDNGISGSAYVEIPINGSKRKGTIYTFATKSFDDWQYDYVAIMAPQCGGQRKLSDANDMFAIAIDINDEPVVETPSGDLVIAGNSKVFMNGQAISGQEGATTVIEDGRKMVYTGEQLSRLVFDVALANYPSSDVLNREDLCR